MGAFNVLSALLLSALLCYDVTAIHMYGSDGEYSQPNYKQRVPVRRVPVTHVAPKDGEVDPSPEADELPEKKDGPLLGGRRRKTHGRFSEQQKRIAAALIEALQLESGDRPVKELRSYLADASDMDKEELLGKLGGLLDTEDMMMAMKLFHRIEMHMEGLEDERPVVDIKEVRSAVADYLDDPSETNREDLQGALEEYFKRSPMEKGRRLRGLLMKLQVSVDDEILKNLKEMRKGRKMSNGPLLYDDEKNEVRKIILEFINSNSEADRQSLIAAVEKKMGGTLDDEKRAFIEMYLEKRMRKVMMMMMKMDGIDGGSTKKRKPNSEDAEEPRRRFGGRGVEEMRDGKPGGMPGKKPGKKPGRKPGSRPGGMYSRDNFTEKKEKADGVPEPEAYITAEPTPDETPVAEASPESTTAPVGASAVEAKASEPGKDSSCFSADVTVELEDGSFKRMDELMVGDVIRVGVEQFSKVFMFTHKIDAITRSFIRIETDSGATLSGVTAGHYIYANGMLVAAESVQTGDVIELANGEKTVVTNTEHVVKTGLYNPQTLHGDIYVDNVRSSTYTMAVEPAFAHAILSPIRALFELLGTTFSILDNGAPAVVGFLPGGGNHEF